MELSVCVCVDRAPSVFIFCSILYVRWLIVGLMKMLIKRSLDYTKGPRAKNKRKVSKGRGKTWIGLVDGIEGRKEGRMEEK